MIAVIMSVVAALSPLQVEKIGLCQQAGGTVYDVSEDVCVVVTRHTDDNGDEQVTIDTYEIQEHE